jgi:hypothetical protein
MDYEGFGRKHSWPNWHIILALEEENYQKTKTVRIASVPDEIWIEHLANQSQKALPWDQSVWWLSTCCCHHVALLNESQPYKIYSSRESQNGLPGVRLGWSITSTKETVWCLCLTSRVLYVYLVFVPLTWTWHSHVGRSRGHIPAAAWTHLNIQHSAVLW